MILMGNDIVSNILETTSEVDNQHVTVENLPNDPTIKLAVAEENSEALIQKESEKTGVKESFWTKSWDTIKEHPRISAGIAGVSAWGIWKLFSSKKEEQKEDEENKKEEQEEKDKEDKKFERENNDTKKDGEKKEVSLSDKLEEKVTKVIEDKTKKITEKVEEKMTGGMTGRLSKLFG